MISERAENIVGIEENKLFGECNTILSAYTLYRQ